MKKQKIISVLVAIICLVSCSASVYASMCLEYVPKYENGSYAEVTGTYDGYVLYDDFMFTNHTGPYGWLPMGTKDNLTIAFNGGYHDYTDAVIRIPDKIYTKKKKYIVTSLRGSCGFKEFDLNPENEYMKCVDNVVFSKDGKVLISFAKYDERTEYVIPEGTEIIKKSAFGYCDNLTDIYFPNSVEELENSAMFACSNLKSVNLSEKIKVIPERCFSDCENLETVTIPNNSELNNIEENAFFYCKNLSELYIPSFDIEIDKNAFYHYDNQPIKIQLKCYVQPKLSVSENKLSWEKIPNASYYEIYQKLNSGEYKLLKTTKATACKFTTLKSGKNYTFAVKPVAVIPAANFDKEKDEGVYPENFTIEGTMSEDIVLTGK